GRHLNPAPGRAQRPPSSQSPAAPTALPRRALAFGQTLAPTAERPPLVSVRRRGHMIVSSRTIPKEVRSLFPRLLALAALAILPLVLACSGSSDQTRTTATSTGTGSAIACTSSKELILATT